jgi:hypothetical protein
MTTHDASINYDDGHIRLRPGYRLDSDELQAVKDAGFYWKRGEQCFHSVWHPNAEDFLATEFGIEELRDDDTDLIERAESRADWYQGFSDNAKARGESRDKTAHEMAQAIPFGQPILIGHHSEKRDRAYRARIRANSEKGWQEMKRARYWEARAKAAVAWTERRYRPDAIYRRIEKIKKQIRKHEKATSRPVWEYTEWPWLESRGATDQDAAWERRLTFENRWLQFLSTRLEYQEALYKESGGVHAEATAFEVGGACRSWAGWSKIVRVNKKSLTVSRHIRDDIYWKERITYDKVTGSMTKAEWEAAKGAT